MERSRISRSVMGWEVDWEEDWEAVVVSKSTREGLSVSENIRRLRAAYHHYVLCLESGVHRESGRRHNFQVLERHQLVNCGK
jgi:hypothetical protein